jgi:DNA-binding Lrp family transcriptional regulator
MALDELDRSILRSLQKNGKLTNEELGRMLSKPPSTIRDHIRRLEEERGIMGYSVVVDEGRVGIGGDAYLAMDVPPEMMDEALSEALSTEGVQEVLHVTGGRRIMLRVQAETPGDLLRLIDRKLRPLGFRDIEVIGIIDHISRHPGI